MAKITRKTNTNMARLNKIVEYKVEQREEKPFIDKINRGYDIVSEANKTTIASIERYLNILNIKNIPANILSILNSKEKETCVIDAAISIIDQNIKGAKANQELEEMMIDEYKNMTTTNKDVLLIRNNAMTSYDKVYKTYQHLIEASQQVSEYVEDYNSYSKTSKIKIFDMINNYCEQCITVFKMFQHANETFLKGINKCNELIKVTNDIQCAIKTLKQETDTLLDEVRNEVKKNNIVKKNNTTQKQNPWNIVKIHGFSVNKMYTAISNGRMARSSEYNQWIASALCEMKYEEMPSLARIGVNPNKPMKLEVEFKLVKGSDTDNPLKAFIDLLVRYYKLNDDNNFADIHVTRNPIWANTRSEGNIKFRISNM